MIKILLIQPKTPETFWNTLSSSPLTKTKSNLAPLGLATVAALTPPDFEVEIVDEDIEEIHFDASYNIVGITGYTLHSQRMFEIASHYRKRGVLTVGGGPYCSSHPKEAEPHFDVLVCGEVEYVWKEFLEDWRQGNHKKFYQGGDRIDLSISPAPRWDLVKLEYYDGSVVQTSRGCPYNCEFCDVVSLFGRGNRYKPIENIMKEIQALVYLNQNSLFIADDNFIGNKKFVKKLLREFIEFNSRLKRPIRYVTQVTLDVAKDLELLDLFKRANFYMLFIGIESPNEESLIATNKKHNLQIDMKEAVRRIQSRGILVICGMVVGFDMDRPDVFRRQKDFLKEAGLCLPFLGMLTALKGTKLWDRLKKEGRLLPHLDEGNSFSTVNFIPKKMTREQLKENYVGLLREVFSHSHFLETFENLIDQIDIDEIRNASPLAKQGDLLSLVFYFGGTVFRLIRYYLFNKNREERKFFWSVIRMAYRKSPLCLSLALYLLFFFKGEKEFVERNLSYVIRPPQAEIPGKDSLIYVSPSSKVVAEISEDHSY
ncbi:MAG: radical SAM protein [Nitrospinaceae bacterium]